MMTATTPQRYRFNVKEYTAMAESGILREDDRVELIEGEILQMSPIGKRHAGCVKRLNLLLIERLGRSAIVSIQDPVQLSDLSEPQPDIALLRPQNDFYSLSHPAPGDVQLIIEVVDSSLDYDREVKIPLYARAGILEVWLLDLTTDTLTAFSQPFEGEYHVSHSYRRGEGIASATLPDLSLTLEEILG